VGNWVGEANNHTRHSSSQESSHGVTFSTERLVCGLQVQVCWQP